MPETIDPGDYRVSTLGRLFARATFRDGTHSLDEAGLNRIVDRAIGLFEAGDIHAARALFYLATPSHVIAARALDALGVPPPRRRRPLTGPPADPTTDPTDDGAPYGGRGLARLLAAPVGAQVLLWENARRDTDGRLLGVYAPAPVVWPPGLCGHLETICPQCLLSWADDHALALFDHGPDGAAAGCQCPTCHPQHTAPPQPTSTPDPGPRGSLGGEPTAAAGPAAPHSAAAPEAASSSPAGAGGGRHGREVTAAGHTVHLSIDPATGLTAVSYPDSPPRRLGTGPHLAVLAAVAEALDLVLTWAAPAGIQPVPGKPHGERA